MGNGNWGKPDFDNRSEEQRLIDRDAPDLREKLKAEGKMYMWPHNELVSPGYDKDAVKRHCVDDPNWQAIRLSMKGIPTHEKLKILKDWWDQQREAARIENNHDLWWATEVQVGNYLGALRRGGQLDYANRVRKYI